MLNQTVLVGRLTSDPKLYETENENKVTNITLAVPRSYKNADGEYDTDFVDCVLWKGLAENLVTYAKKGDLIGIKGRLESNSYETENGEKRKEQYVIAEKVTFLASKKHECEDELNM